jgi:hypothetical protein
MTRFLFSLFACGCVLALSSAAPAPVRAPDLPAGKTPKDTCVKPCFDCAAECLACMKHAREHLKMEDVAKQCEVCHHACLMCAHAVASKNVRAWEICELCEKVCNDCAAVCEKGTDEHMKKCAKACRDCAKACAEARK